MKDHFQLYQPYDSLWSATWPLGMLSAVLIGKSSLAVRMWGRTRKAFRSRIPQRSYSNYTYTWECLLKPQVSEELLFTGGPFLSQKWTTTGSRIMIIQGMMLNLTCWEANLAGGCRRALMDHLEQGHHCSLLLTAPSKSHLLCAPGTYHTSAAM